MVEGKIVRGRWKGEVVGGDDVGEDDEAGGEEELVTEGYQMKKKGGLFGKLGKGGKKGRKKSAGW